MSDNDQHLIFEPEGLQRRIPLRTCGDSRYPSLRLTGDVLLTNVCAGVMAPRLAELQWDVILAAGCDAVPMAHMLSSFLGRENYAVCGTRTSGREARYPVEAEELCLRNDDISLLEGSEVLLLQAAVSSRRPAEKVRQLLDEIGAELAALAAVMVSVDISGADDYVCIERFNPHSKSNSNA